MRLKIFLVFICLFLALISQERSFSAFLDANGTELAIQGYDPVAYHAEGKCLKGYPNLYFRYRGMNWHFCNSRNKDLFLNSPSSYVPAYLGYCAYCMSRNSHKKHSNPRVWVIEGNKLYLFANGGYKKKWQKDRKHHIETADKNWEVVY